MTIQDKIICEECNKRNGIPEEDMAKLYPLFQNGVLGDIFDSEAIEFAMDTFDEKRVCVVCFFEYLTLKHKVMLGEEV